MAIRVTLSLTYDTQEDNQHGAIQLHMVDGYVVELSRELAQVHVDLEHFEPEYIDAAGDV